MNQSKALTEGVIFASVYFVLLLLSYFVPFLSIIITFTLPLPFIIYTYRYGLNHSFIMFIVTAIISSLFATFISLPITLLMGFGGIAIGLGLNSKKSPYETLAWGTVGYSIGLAIVYVITQFFFQINWVEEIRTAIDQSLSTYISTYEQFGSQIDEETVELLREQMNNMVNKIPTGIVMFGLLFAWITQWLSYKVINRLEKTSFAFPSFKNFSLPSSMIWYFFLGIVLTMFTKQGDSLYFAGDNLYTLAGLLLTIQGLSFVFYFIHYKKWPKGVPIIVIVLLFLTPYLVLYPLKILGIIDLGFQLRDRLSKK